MVYVPSWGAVNPLGLVPGDPKVTDMAYVQGQAERQMPTVQGLPLFKPPYMTISAINLDSGDIVWQVAHGETPDEIRNHPALKGKSIPRTGRGGLVGVLTTSTLVIAGERGTFTDAQGRVGALLRAYDKATGKDAGAVYMPNGQTGSPMTYSLNGKQYIVIAIGGQSFPAELIAYKLPDASSTPAP
jgi:quinoprotein glucose dehydrogenase